MSAHDWDTTVSSLASDELPPMLYARRGQTQRYCSSISSVGVPAVLPANPTAPSDASFPFQARECAAPAKLGTGPVNYDQRRRASSPIGRRGQKKQATRRVPPSRFYQSPAWCAPRPTIRRAPREPLYPHASKAVCSRSADEPHAFSVLGRAQNSNTPTLCDCVTGFFTVSRAHPRLLACFSP